MKKEISILLFILTILLILAHTNMVGVLSVLIVSLIVFFLSQHWRSVATILYVALFIRVFVIFLDNNFINLPDSQGDAYYFELRAYEWSQLGFPDALFNYPGWEESYFISYILSIFYSLTDRSLLIGQSISLLLGTSVVLLSWIIAQKIWDRRVAMKVGWLTALYPTLILYSSLVMREIYVIFFLLLTLNFMIDWYRANSIKSFFLVIVCFMAGASFHGGIFVGLIVFILIILMNAAKIIFIKLIKSMIPFKLIILFGLIIASSASLVLSSFHIPKIGPLNNFDYIKKNILKKNMGVHRGDAKYPIWTIATSETELIYKLPIRVVYLVFSPFPWDVKKTSHLLGMFDGFFHMFLVYLIFCNRKVIWADPVLKIILLMLFAYLIVYGIAVANFGTGVRHRTKFIVMFILLVAQLLPKFNFSRKNKKKK